MLVAIGWRVVSSGGVRRGKTKRRRGGCCTAVSTTTSVSPPTHRLRALSRLSASGGGGAARRRAAARRRWLLAGPGWPRCRPVGGGCWAARAAAARGPREVRGICAGYNLYVYTYSHATTVCTRGHTSTHVGRGPRRTIDDDTENTITPHALEPSIEVELGAGHTRSKVPSSAAAQTASAFSTGGDTMLSLSHSSLPLPRSEPG